MYPEHPNLLPAFYDSPEIIMKHSNQTSRKDIEYRNWVSKPLFGREGYGVFHSNNFTNYDAFVRTTEDNFGMDYRTNAKMGNSIY